MVDAEQAPDTEAPRAEAELLRDAPTRAMQHLSRYADVPGLAPDWYLLVHRALEALGRDPEDLLGFAERAAPAAWLERRRSPSGASPAATHCARGALHRGPRSPGGARVP